MKAYKSRASFFECIFAIHVSQDYTWACKGFEGQGQLKVHFLKKTSYRFVAVGPAPAFVQILNNALVSRAGGARGRWKRGWRRCRPEWRAPWRLHRAGQVGEIGPPKLIKGRQWGGKLRGMGTARQLHEEHSGRALCHGLLVVHQSLWGPSFTRSGRTAVINFCLHRKNSRPERV